MSDTAIEPAWVWQGFEGPVDLATAGKLITDELPNETAGVKIPLPGMPPMLWNGSGTRAMWAIQVRPNDLQPIPPGCETALSNIVGRLVGG